MTNSYWRDRELEHMKKVKKSDAEIAKAIQSLHNQTMKEIEQQIEAFYGRYATAEGITMAEAKKRVSKLDIDEYAKKAKRYVKGAHSGNEFIAAQSFTDAANAEMAIYNLTMKVNRLELLKANIALDLAAMTSDEEHHALEKLTESAREEFARQSGILGMTIAENEKSVSSIVNASFHNATWSERLWANQSALKAELETLLTRGIIQGKNPKVLARDLRKSFDASIADSERLMITEMARIQEEVFRESMEQAGIDEYEYIAEAGACHICAPLDGKVFKVKDGMPGSNKAPMHPRCRCSSAAHYNREAWEASLNREQAPKKNRLTKNEERAINQYISSESYKVNEKLRRNLTLTKEDKQLMKNLDAALRKMPKYEGDLTRSLYFSNEESLDSFVRKHPIDGITQYKEYTSTTKGDTYNPAGQVQMYIFDSNKGKDISKYNPRENEVLYERNVRFKVKGNEEINGIYHILLEEYDGE